MQSNPFERHGIDHLSPSSLNLWAAEPALWVMERLLGRRSPISANAARGRAAEQGIHLGLLDPSLAISYCVVAALREFDREMALSQDPRREAERDKIAGYVEQGILALRPYGVPTGYQEKVSVTLDDVPVPVIGFIDWRYDQHGMVVDLKTSERLPSSISETHGRQGAIYARAHDNYAMRFAYVKPVPGKKDGRAAAVYEMSGEDVARHLGAFTEIALRLGRFLALSGDADELAGLLVPNYDAFYWNNATTRANGAAVFGF
jgi:hypothetical protein